eukprot:4415249-Prymnesium_polylepis.1
MYSPQPHTHRAKHAHTQKSGKKPLSNFEFSGHDFPVKFEADAEQQAQRAQCTIIVEPPWWRACHAACLPTT